MRSKDRGSFAVPTLAMTASGISSAFWLGARFSSFDMRVKEQSIASSTYPCIIGIVASLRRARRNRQVIERYCLRDLPLGVFLSYP